MIFTSKKALVFGGSIGLLILVVAIIAKFGNMESQYKNSVGMEFVNISAGTFQIGSKTSSNDDPIHVVNIKSNYAIGVTEVTLGEWKAVT